MVLIDKNKPLRVHFIGIGGVSMSGLAEILLQEGFTVSGSDRTESKILDRLREKGAKVLVPQDAANIPEETELVVYTAAIKEDNPEFVRAKEMEIPMMTRAELLGAIMAHYGNSVAVAGTHGKTTTTSMLTDVLLAEEKDPTVTVGGELSSIGGNIRVGMSDVFVAEACEYTNSFLSFFPRYTIITNVEAEHLDFFKDEEDVRNSFARFIRNTAENGAVIIHAGIRDYRELTKGIRAKVISYGIDIEADAAAEEISFDEKGNGSFTARYRGETLGRIVLSVPGIHNITNSLAVIALAKEMGISDEGIINGLHAFTGAGRRFEIKGKTCGVTVVDDYAHHPTEIRSTLAAAKQVPHGRIVVAFQPHTYSRLKAFLPDFADALSMADLVVLSDVYAAREKNTYGISSTDLLRELEKRGVESAYFPSFSEIEKFLLKKCMNNDLLITMGAGDIYKVGENLLGKN